MSEETTAVVDEATPSLGSLEARIAEARERVEKTKTELFDVPRFPMLKVELRLLGGKTKFQIVQKNSRLNDEYQKGLRTAADAIMATTSIQQVTDEQGHSKPIDGWTWKDVFRAASRGAAGPEVSHRDSLVGALGEEGVEDLLVKYEQWRQQIGSQAEDEIALD